MRGFVRSVAKAGVHKHRKHDDKHAEAGMGTCRSVSQIPQRLLDCSLALEDWMLAETGREQDQLQEPPVVKMLG